MPSPSSTAAPPRPPASAPPATLIAAHVLQRVWDLIESIRAQQLADLHEEMTPGISTSDVVAEVIG
eukprot:4057185-Pyramimonas_sp.AAC.1